MRIVPLILGLAAAALLASPLRAQGPEERNEATVRAMVEAVNARDLDRLDGLIAADVVRHSQSTPGVEVRSLADFKAFLRSDFASVPDSEITCPIVVADAGHVATWCRYEGTQEGPFGPYPPSGKRLSLDFASVMRMEGGEIAEMWVVWDNLTALTQLGHIEPPGELFEGQRTAVSDEGCTLLDFEAVPDTAVSEGLVVGDQFLGSLGMSFALEDGTRPRLAEVGPPTTAFLGRGEDGPSPDQGIGSYFLTDDGELRGSTSSPLIVAFSQPVDSASGVVLDIDYSERFTIQARDTSGRVLQTVTISAGDPGTGNGIATPWGFGRESADVASIRFEGTRESGRFGLAFDNFVTCAPGRVARD